eukprot:gene16654-18344_t
MHWESNLDRDTLRRLRSEENNIKLSGKLAVFVCKADEHPRRGQNPRTKRHFGREANSHVTNEREIPGIE